MYVFICVHCKLTPVNMCCNELLLSWPAHLPRPVVKSIANAMWPTLGAQFRISRLLVAILNSLFSKVHANCIVRKPDCLCGCLSVCLCVWLCVCVCVPVCANRSISVTQCTLPFCHAPPSFFCPHLQQKLQQVTSAYCHINPAICKLLPNCSYLA